MKNILHLILGMALSASAQTYFYADSINIIKNGKNLPNSLTGGLNSCQFNNFDLNNDGIKDLVVFDKTSQKILPFFVIKNGTQVSYKYAPEHESFFPACEKWVLLRDYDQDGNEDLFTYTTLGIKAYRCIRKDDLYYFQLVKSLLFSDYFGNSSNILINPDDYPIIDDMDNDGDLDIVNFNFMTGARLEMHKNLSIETYKHTDSLVFKQTDECFGGFEEISCDSSTFNLNCKLQRNVVDERHSRLQHVGSGALLNWDVDGDKIQDLMLSKVDCNHINWLKNIGSNAVPNYESKIYKFAPDQTFTLNGFPTPFAVDTDGDGSKEIIISYGATSSGYILNFEASNHLFDKDLKPLKNNFLQETTLDLGENSAPVLHDYDHDGDQDLLVGYHSFRTNQKYRSGIAVFENILSDQDPIYSFRDIDYMNLSDNQWVNIIPQFFDINQDGNVDLLVTASTPLDILKTFTFVYFGKNATYFDYNNTSDTLTLPLNIDDVPFFTQYPSESACKALVGKSSGKLSLYTKSNDSWTLDAEFLGFVPDVYTKQTAVAEANIDGDDQEDLLICNSKKRLLYVKNYKTLQLGAWSIDTLRFFNTHDGFHYPITLSQRPTLYSKFDKAHKSEIWAGCKSGGIFCLRESKNTSPSPHDQSVFPNPFSKEIIVKSSTLGHYKLYDLLGKLLADGILNKGYNILDFPHINKGTYILQTEVQTLRIIKD